MSKVLVLLLTVAALVFVVWGCSQDRTPMSSDPETVLSTARVGQTDVLIGFKSEHPGRAIQAAGGSIKREYKYVPIVFASLPAAAVDALRNNPNVLYVEPDMTRTLVAQVLDWGVDRVDAEYVHNNSNYTGAGIDIAVLDTGGDMDHPDLTWAGGYSVANSDPNDWEDKNGHGTHCAGIISADNNTIGVVGVAPGCDIWAVQVSRTSLISISDIIAGIDWCIATHHDSDPNNDIKVMSMSFSGPSSDAETTALLAAYNEDILLVAAAGNSGGPVEYPAAHSFVMAISASTSTDAKASYSCYGPEIEHIAPGSSIYSTYKGGKYRTMSGTSMACPMVAGAAVLAWSAHPGYSRDQIRTLLHNTGEDIGLSSDYQGYGLIDAENATLGTTNGNDY
ncbi:MAG: peptidase S8 [candidate division Zixibacteria bacterium HGW-Zixibacteria-1]|nr:MAG: peptidase S8 [candidate division Zixibacteria bacterium HGW-Zixibacteria-1]